MKNRKKYKQIDLKLTENMKSLKILFLSICLIYAGRFIQYVISQVTSVELGDKLDPLLIVFKTVMVCGICLSI